MRVTKKYFETMNISNEYVCGLFQMEDYWLTKMERHMLLERLGRVPARKFIKEMER